MRFLALDTTTSFLSVAVMEDEKVLACVEVASTRNTSSRLFPLVEYVLEVSGVEKSDLDFVALAVGPGSFTGVRVGVAAVKGFAYALSLKVVAVSTLEAMAYGLPVEGMLLFPLLDARRGQFYGSMFRWFSGRCERLTEDMLLDPEDVERVADSVTFLGEVAGRLGFTGISLRGIAPYVGLCALERARSGKYTSLADLKPVYLRPSDAEESKGIVVYKG